MDRNFSCRYSFYYNFPPPPLSPLVVEIVRAPKPKPELRTRTADVMFCAHNTVVMRRDVRSVTGRTERACGCTTTTGAVLCDVFEVRVAS